MSADHCELQLEHSGSLIVNRIPLPTEVYPHKLADQPWQINTPHGVIYGVVDRLFLKHWRLQVYFPLLSKITPSDGSGIMINVLTTYFAKQAGNFLATDCPRVVRWTGLDGKPQILAEKNIFTVGNMLGVARANMESPLHTQEFFDKDLQEERVTLTPINAPAIPENSTPLPIEAFAQNGILYSIASHKSRVPQLAR